MTRWAIIKVDNEYIEDIDMRMHTREYTLLKTRAMRVSKHQVSQVKNHLMHQGIDFRFEETSYKPQTAKRFNFYKGE